MTLFKRDGTSEGSASVVSPKVSIFGQGSVSGGGEVALDNLPTVRAVAETAFMARKHFDELQAKRETLLRQVGATGDRIAALQAKMDLPGVEAELEKAEIETAQAAVVHEAVRDRERARIIAERAPHEREERRALLKALEQAAERVKALHEYKVETEQRIGGRRAFEPQTPDWGLEFLDEPSSFCQAGRESNLTTWRRRIQEEGLI